LKLSFLGVALLFHYTLVRNAAARRTPARTDWLVACVSLSLWTLVLSGGIFIGYGSAASALFPAILSVHLVALVALGGMIVVTDLRLSESLNGLRIPKLIAFVLAAASGIALLGFEPAQYAHNRWFWIKMGLLALVGLNYVIFRRGACSKPSAALSLLLWTGVAFAARGPATIKDIMHSMADPSGDFLFKSVREISDEHGVREEAPKTDADWEDVRQRLLILEDVPDLLTVEGRRAARPKDRSKNPQVENEPWEVQSLLDADRTNFIRRALRLHDAAAVAMKAADAKDPKALSQALDGIDRACENCHLHYWYPHDKRAQEAARENGNSD
jgi:hypothetical protein